MRSGPEEVAVRAELERVLASSEFVHAEKLSRFLRFVVEESLAGRADRLKEAVIGVEVYGKPASYDPRTDSVVRGEASKLRARLQAYYARRGSAAGVVIIRVPKGGYVPEFTIGSRRPRALAAWPALRWTLAGAVLMALAWAITWALSSRPAPQEFLFRQLTAEGRLTITPALSRDGSMVAYASDRGEPGNLDIWLQATSGGSAIRLTDHSADDYEPAISPDGGKVAFRSERAGGGIYLVPALGGEARLLAAGGRRPRFSPDGRHVAFYTGGHVATPTRLHVIDSAGENRRVVELPVPWAALPSWSPDGRSLLFLGSTDPPGLRDDWGWDWWVAPASGGEAFPLGVSALLQRTGLRGFGRDWWLTGPALSTGVFGLAVFPEQWAGDRILFSAQQSGSANLWEVRISPRTNRVAGKPERLTSGSGREIHFGASSGMPRPLRIAFSSLTSNADVWSLPADMDRGLVTGSPQPLTTGASDEYRPSAAVDGSKVVFLSTRAGNVDVWSKDLNTGAERAITATPWNETHALISRDGARLAYVADKPDGRWVYTVSSAGGEPEALCNSCGMPLDWSPDGKTLLAWWGRPIRFGTLDIATGARTELLSHPTRDILRAQYSPDGEWIAFQLPTDTRGFGIAVAPARASPGVSEGDWIRVTGSSQQDTFPLWSPDGGSLYFVSDRDGFWCLWRAPLDPTTKRPREELWPFYHFHGASRPPGKEFGGAVTRRGLLFTLATMTGDIWLMQSVQ